mmetsp:Transcript_21966/g.30179  ORF Transcript_21966/g.30179 Transcript_21966/m.30179 type:complete len:182 (-) Transcript_21966:95-640(-)
MLAALLLITHAGCCGVAQGGAPMTTPSMQLSPPHSVGACVRGPAVGRRRRALRHSQLSVSVAPCARQGDKAAAGVGGECGGKRGDGGKRGSGRAARPGALLTGQWLDERGVLQAALLVRCPPPSAALTGAPAIPLMVTRLLLRRGPWWSPIAHHDHADCTIAGLTLAVHPSLFMCVQLKGR